MWYKWKEPLLCFLGLIGNLCNPVRRVDNQGKLVSDDISIEPVPEDNSIDTAPANSVERKYETLSEHVKSDQVVQLIFTVNPQTVQPDQSTIPVYSVQPEHLIHVKFAELLRQPDKLGQLEIQDKSVQTVPPDQVIRFELRENSSHTFQPVELNPVQIARSDSFVSLKLPKNSSQPIEPDELTIRTNSVETPQPFEITHNSAQSKPSYILSNRLKLPSNQIPPIKSDADSDESDLFVDFKQSCDSSTPICDVEFVLRDQWGARELSATELLQKPVPYIIVHTEGSDCTTKDECIKLIQWLQNKHRKSWHDIMYNFIIGGEGRVYVGRGWSTVGGHSPNYTDKSISVNFMTDDMQPSKLQAETARKLIECGINQNKISQNYELFTNYQLQRNKNCPETALLKEFSTWELFSNNPPHIENGTNHF